MEIDLTQMQPREENLFKKYMCFDISIYTFPLTLETWGGGVGGGVNSSIVAPEITQEFFPV